MDPGILDRPGDRELADPSAVRVRYKAPSEATFTEKVYGVGPEVVKEGIGRYALLLVASEAGLWQYRWEGDNVAPAILESSFVVRRTVLT